MRKSMVDFTTGSIPCHLITFAIPMFLGNLLQALYNTVDSIWVGRYLGHRALAAVSVSGPITFALIAMVMGLTMATTTMVAQYYGAQQPHMVKRTVTNALVLQAILGVLFSLLGYYLRIPILNLVNAPADIMADAAAYLGIFSLGLIGMFLYNAAGAILRGLGDSRTPLKFLAYATVANIILDPLFIFGFGPIPKMGVAGAALATILAQGGSAFLALMHLGRVAGLLHMEGDFWKLDPHLTAQTFKIGLPAGIQQTLVSLSGMVVSSIVNSFGSVAVAGFGAAGRIDQFSFMPSMSVGLAVSALVGQNMGAGKDERVTEIVRWSVLLGGGITAAVSLFAVIYPDPLIALFTQDVAVLEAGKLYLRYVGLSYVPFSIMFALSGVMRGAGDTLATMFISVGTLWVVRVPLATFLSRMPNLGIVGVWLGITSSPFMGVILNYVYYRTGRWKKAALVRRQAGQPVVELED